MERLMKLVICFMVIALPLVGLNTTPSFAKIEKKQEAKKEAAVYVTTNGKKYHKEGCRFIKNRETIVMNEDEAVTDGLAPCGWCFKERIKAEAESEE